MPLLEGSWPVQDIPRPVKEQIAFEARGRERVDAAWTVSTLWPQGVAPYQRRSASRYRMRKVSIFAPGLLGASLALGLKERGAVHIRVWARREESAAAALSRGLADEASTDAAAMAQDADIVVLCMPVGAMEDAARKVVPVLRPDTLVTDVGSVKAPVVRVLEPIFEGRARFIGSHPMAGSERTGMDASRPDLFSDAVCFLTPTDRTAAAAVEDATAFWSGIGCRVRVTGPDDHDQIVALISHMPHLLAAALVTAVNKENPRAFEFAGPGFRDTTRIAGGSPHMWTEILRENSAEVLKSLQAMIENLREIERLLASDDPEREYRLNEFLSLAKERRDRLRLPNPRNA